MSEATQTANPTDAREASKSRVSTQETILAKLAPQEAAKEPEQPEKADTEHGKEGESKAKKGPAERIQELANKRREAEAQAAAEKRRADELEARLHAIQAQAKPLEVNARPLRSQYATEDEYIEALTDWKAKDALAKRELEQAQARYEAEQAEIASQWTRRQEKVMKVLPDYAEVIGGSEVSIPDHIHQAILESDQGPQIAYYLALHPDEAKRIAQMKPVSGVKRIASLEHDLAAIEEEEPESEKEKDKPQVQKSKAPPPIEPVRSSPSAGGSADSFEEYKRRRQAEQRK